MNIQKTQHTKLQFVCLKTPIEEFLSKDDIDYYLKLKNTLSSHICRNCRNRRVESFSEVLTTIHYFVMRKNEDSWKRSLICGICWYQNYIVVNIRQMSYLLEKCKSSINGSFQRLYFIVLPDKQKSLKIIIEAIPYLKNKPDLIQTWSVRQQIQITPISVPFFPVNQFTFLNFLNNINNNTKSSIQANNVTIAPTNIATNTENNIQIKDQGQIPIKSKKNTDNKIRTNSSSELFSDIFEDNELSDSILDKFNIF